MTGKPRLGIVLSTVTDAPVEEFIDIAQLAEQNGYESVLVNEGFCSFLHTIQKRVLESRFRIFHQTIRCQKKDLCIGCNAGDSSESGHSSYQNPGCPGSMQGVVRGNQSAQVLAPSIHFSGSRMLVGPDLAGPEAEEPFPSFEDLVIV